MLEPLGFTPQLCTSCVSLGHRCLLMYIWAKNPPVWDACLWILGWAWERQTLGMSETHRPDGKRSFVNTTCRRARSEVPRSVYRLAGGSWEPLSATKHAGATFTPLLQGGLAGKGKAKVSYAPNCQTLAAFMLQHRHAAPCMYETFYSISFTVHQP